MVSEKKLFRPLPGTIALYANDKDKIWTYRRVLAFELVTENGDTFWAERVGDYLGLMYPSDSKPSPNDHWEYVGLGHVKDMKAITADFAEHGLTPMKHGFEE